MILVQYIVFYFIDNPLLSFAHDVLCLAEKKKESLHAGCDELSEDCEEKSEIGRTDKGVNVARNML